MRYMVIERYKPGTKKLIYQRVAAHGRLIPDTLRYVNSWISADLTTCYQLMDCDDETAFETWTSQWEDLVDFEIVPVVSSEEASRLAMKRS